MGDAEPGAAAPSTRLIVGLGNPGAEYRDTRHHVGFRVVEEVARRAGVRLRAGECNSLVGEANGVVLALPRTSMNRSVYAVRGLVERREVPSTSILVVLDEIALPLGRLRLRPAGSPGGHRGLESILESLQTGEGPRLRLGVREDEQRVVGEGLVDYVLGPFTAAAAERVD